MRAQKFQFGLSMIELLVALLIGSFLVLGITQIYIDNRRSYAFQQNQSENQEGSRYAMLLLQQELDKAGYRRRPDESMDYAFPANNTLAGCSFQKGQAVLWNDTSKSLCIRYQPRSDADRDCLGKQLATTPATPYTEASGMFIERIYFDANESRLMCANPTGAGELLSGVAGLQFELGLANSVDSRVLDRYVAQSTVTDKIVTVRYMALMRSSGARVRDTSDDSPAFDRWQTTAGVADEAIEDLKSDDTGQIYQIGQSTVMLRNLMP